MPPAASSASSGGLGDFDFGDFGGANAPGPNPYTPPSPGFGAPGAYTAPRQYTANAGRSEALYIIPAIFIMLWSILVVIGSIFRLVGMAIVLATKDVPAEAYPRVVGFVVGALFTMVIGITMIVGSINMFRRTGLSSARTAAILALIPCFGGCVFPIGIWATVLLFSGSVKKDFNE